jgi:uncharacterized protein YegL
VRVSILPRLEYRSVPRTAEPLLHMLVDVTADGSSFLDAASGPVAHVILLLDLSASMHQGGKYPVLEESLERLLAELRAPGEAPVLLSIVVFSKGAKTVFRDVLAADLDPASVLDELFDSPLRFAPYTDLAGALKRAGSIAVDQLRANRAMPVRVYVLTDGRPQDLARTRQVWTRISQLPVDVHCLAFGEDADVRLLQSIVSGGRGGTVKQVRVDTITDAFDRIGRVAQRIVSNRAIVELTLAPGVVGGAAYRYRPGRHRFGEDSFTGGTSFRTDIGTIESGRRYSLLFELRIPETAARETPIGRISVRLRGVGNPRVFEEEVVLPRTSDGALPERDADVAAAADVLATLTRNDPATQIRALRVRHKLYVAERRDPEVVALVQRALVALETYGSLDTLSEADRRGLLAHTVTAGSLRRG